MSRHYVRTAAKVVAITAAALALLMGAGYAWHRYTYPYGFSHYCLTVLGLALRQYAEEHDGHFPAGGVCPEASLSLLDRGHDGVYGSVLCGKTKSAEAATQILKDGGLLNADTCDWHYVEGLTLADDPQLAIIWDKVGLGHNGQRLSGGGHSICRLDGIEEEISESEWPQFLEEQKRLMGARTDAAKKGSPALAAKVRLPSGEVVDHYDAPFTLEDTQHNCSRRGGDKLEGSELRWWRFNEDGALAFELSLNGWKSKPVKVRISQGRAIPSSVIFEMEAENGGALPQSPSSH
jgi:hypothetical protein